MRTLEGPMIGFEQINFDERLKRTLWDGLPNRYFDERPFRIDGSVVRSGRVIGDRWAQIEAERNILSVVRFGA